jgi:hypothetical protein
MLLLLFLRIHGLVGIYDPFLSALMNVRSVCKIGPILYVNFYDCIFILNSMCMKLIAWFEMDYLERIVTRSLTCVDVTTTEKKGQSRIRTHDHY